MSNEYDLTELPDGTFVLERNEKPCVCPFQNTLLVPVASKIIGKQELMIQPQYCTSQCVMFNLKNLRDVKLMCRDVDVAIINFKKLPAPKSSGLDIVN